MAALAPVSGFAAHGWSQLKRGMSRHQAVALLGTELSASRGRGFEVAIYDGKAEVVFLNGQVVAWTAPVEIQAAAAVETGFQFDQVSRLRAANQRARLAPDRAPASGRPAAILPAYRL